MKIFYTIEEGNLLCVIEWYTGDEEMFTEEMFAQRVMELRERLGVSQRDMSLSMGQGAAYINNIENRRALPSMTGFFYMCDYLKIEPKEFFDLDNTNPERLSSIIESIKNMSDEKLIALQNIIEQMK